MKCQLYDKMNCYWAEYTGAFYHKRNSIYGWIVVDLTDVKFFYMNHDMGAVEYELLNDYYEVKYVEYE